MSESIYNLIPVENTTTFTPLNHTSKYNATVKAEAAASKKTGALFGPKGGVKPSTQKFLKKGDGVTLKVTSRASQSKSRGSYEPTVLAPAITERTPAAVRNFVPRHTEKATLAPRSTKEFVKTNRIEAVGATVRRAPSAYIDRVSGTGARFAKETSGLTAKYSRSSGYGKTPKYLTQRKAEMEAAAQAQAEQEQANASGNGLHQITPDERATILEGLKANWESLHREYQGLSMFTDTTPKKTMRNNMEAQLNQLEADINRFERHKVIYVDTRG